MDFFLLLYYNLTIMKGRDNMKNNKEILKYCPNFYKITNYDFEDEDCISLKLINIYEEFIFNINLNDESEIKKAKELDKILSKYVDDYLFRKEVKSGVLNIRVKRGTDILETIVNSLISLFESYEEGYTRNIYFARWI